MWFVCAPHKQYLPRMRRFDWISLINVRVKSNRDQPPPPRATPGHLTFNYLRIGGIEL
jgi:hypothetical protein